jgi:uncharacterized caspase-like protein
MTSSRPFALAFLYAVLLLADQSTLEAQPPNPGRFPDREITGRKIALVIGNDAYPQVPLMNAVNDAMTIQKVMEARGFSVRTLTNAPLQNLDSEVSAFVKSLAVGDIVLLFYSGHGMQIEGDNYLIPVDFSAATEIDAKYKAYSINRILAAISEQKPSLLLVILDACRDNPFRAAKSFQKGWAAMEGAFGTFVAFATSPGSTASDNPRGRNGLFTEQLAASLIKSPNLSLDDLFKTVRMQVYYKSQARQLPWISSSVIGDFRFGHPQAGEEEQRTGSSVDVSVQAAHVTSDRRLNGAAFQNDTRRPDSVPSKTSTDIGRSPGDIMNAAAMFRGQKYLEAITILSAGSGSDDTNSERLQLRALSYAAIGAYPDAIRDIGLALATNQDQDLSHHIGCIVYSLAGGAEAAIREGSEAVKIREDFADAHLCIANAYFSVGKYVQAAVECNRALSLQPSCVECQRLQRQLDSKPKL